MPELTEEQVAQVVIGWRSGQQIVEGWTSPAGPLFSGGAYAESDITMESIFAASGCPGPSPTNICGTACTYSATRQCC